MNLLQEKLYKQEVSRAARAARQTGIYPYFRPIESDQDTVVTINGKRVLMFGSNAYLGLTNHPKVKEAAIEATRRYGTGMAGSRFLNGTLDIHLELERKLADFTQKEDCLVFSAGFNANLGAIGAATGREDYILWDERDHASIIEGIRGSFSTALKFKHNDMASLEKQLQKCNPDKVKLIVVDGVFSMEGDVTDLPAIAALAEKYQANIMVDEAHGLGVMGRNFSGKGVCDHFDLTDRVDLIMGTFSKSLASIGGFISGSEAVIDYLRHCARPYIFSASITPAATAAASAALDIMTAEPQRIEHLWELTYFALDGFRSMGCEIGNTSTPIIPLLIRDNDKTFFITKTLFDQGIFVNPVVSPAVAPTDTLIRFSLMATHTKEQVAEALDKIEKIFKKTGVL